MLIAIAGLIGIAEFLWLDRLSRRSALGRYAGSLLNPLLLLLAFHVLIMADFIQLYTYGYSALGLTIFRFYRGEVAYAALVYVFLFGWLELGIQLGLRSSQNMGTGSAGRWVTSLLTSIPSAVSLALFVLICGTSASILGQLMAKYGMAGSINASAAYIKAYGLSDNPISRAAVLLLFPAYAAFACRFRVVSFWFLVVTVLVGTLVLMTGSRSNLLLLMLIVGTVYLQQGGRMPRVLFWPLFLFFVGISVWYIASFRSFDSSRFMISGLFGPDGVVVSTLGTPDVSAADALTVVVNEKSPLYRIPGSSVASALLFPVPRALAPWKPYPASIDFTKVFDPKGWHLAHRGLTIGGLAEIYVEFGLLIGGPILALLGYIWMRSIVVSIRMGYLAHIFTFPILYYMANGFLRGDLALAFQTPWFFVFFALVAGGGALIVHPGRRLVVQGSK